MGYRPTTSYHRRGTTGIRRRPTTIRRRRKQTPEGLIIAAFIAVAVLGLGVFYAMSRPVADNANGKTADEGIEWQPHQTTRPEPVSPPVQPVVTSVGPPAPPVVAAKPPVPQPAPPPATAKPLAVVPPALPPVVNDTPSETPTLPWVDDPDSRHATVPAPAKIREGWFEIATSMPTLPKVRCDYRIPLNANDRPLATAADIVLLFPYPTEKAAITGIARPLSEKLGFSAVSIRFPGMGPKDGVDGDDRSRWYYWPESGSGKAWLDAIARVRKIGNFPERKVFVTGRSGGGSAAGLFADAHPESVAAVANEAGRVFADALRFKGPILLMHGAHDYVVPPIMAFEEKAKTTGAQLTRLTYPATWAGRGTNQIWQHGINGAAEQAMWRWLVDVADMRIQLGEIPPMASWPVKSNPANLPSQETLRLLDEVTPASSTINIPKGRAAISFPAPAKTPKGLIVVGGLGFSSDIEELALDAEYFADNGWVAYSVATDDTLSLLTACRFIESKNDLRIPKGLPRFLVLDEARTLADLPASTLSQYSGLFLCRLSPTPLLQLGLLSEKIKVPIQIVDRSEFTTAAKALIGNSNFVSYRAIKPTKMAIWHRMRCSAVLEQVENLRAKDK